MNQTSLSSIDRTTHVGTEEFRALDDISFEINPGEVVGIIGRNGAGKSTLLKVLSRITEPTSGRAEIRGRVGSLLEVGTGFHTELTGRENVYLSGSILGMSRRDIGLRFDEIVAFSGIERFLETPIKRYSTGMQVRLAFAVAAYLEPEILIIDEVLAVGDAKFQRRCLGQMERIAQSGRTVLFVSHNMAAVEGLCSHGIVLESGRLTYAGSQTNAIQSYMKSIGDVVSYNYYRAPLVGRDGDQREIGIREVRVTSENKYCLAGYAAGEPLEFRVYCNSSRRLTSPSLGIGINDSMGQRIVTLHTEFGPCDRRTSKTPGKVEFLCKLGRIGLRPGEYRIKLSFEDGVEELHAIEEALTMNILPTDYYCNGGRFGRGVILCDQVWEVTC